MEVTQRNTHRELPTLVPFLRWVTGVPESFSGISFTCQQALGLILAEGFIYAKADERPHLLPHCLCRYQGTELRARYSAGPPSSWHQLLRLTPSSSLHADHQRRACWHDVRSPGKAVPLETSHQTFACTNLGLFLPAELYHLY